LFRIFKNNWLLFGTSGSKMLITFSDITISQIGLLFKHPINELM
jgi:hypothetical protein